MKENDVTIEANSSDSHQKFELSLHDNLPQTSNVDSMHKSISVPHLIAISFFYICSGPFGQGQVISSAGAKYTFIFTLLVPVFFAVPLALISSEQATRLPMCGGCVEWGYVLGGFVGTLNTYVRFLCSVFDNAIYPVMAYDYLLALIPGINKTIYKVITVLVVNLIAIILNIFGLEVVGIASIILAVLIVTPFLIFFFLGIPAFSLEKIFADKPKEYGSVDWYAMISTLVWQFGGFDTVSALAEETKNPKRTFPVALSFTIVLVTLMYLLPTIAGVSVEPDLDIWKSGGFPSVAKLLPFCENGWLSYWICIGGLISGLSLLNISISCTGRETFAGALFNSFPFSSFLSKLHYNNKGEPSPINAIIFMSLLTIPFSFFHFSMLVEWAGLLTVIQQLIQIASFVACRFPSRIKAMKQKRKELLKNNEQLLMENPEIDNDKPENSSSDLLQEDEDMSTKFIIPGGWIGVVLVVTPIFLPCIFLFLVIEIESIIICTALIAGMFLLKGMYKLLLMACSKCKKE